MRAFLSGLDSQSTMVGLTVLPPATSVGNACATPSANNYNLTNAAYTVVPLSRGYTDKGGKLITSHPLVTTINCVKGAGSTSYANAVEAAQKELDTNGRPDVTDVIVFFSDGAANTGPSYYPSNSPYRTKPCHQGVTSSGYSKAKGTLVYVIGYDLDANNGGANKCTSYTGQDESPAITAYQALSQMASDPKKFYEKTSPGDLTNIFEDISGDLMYGSSALIDNNTT
jgi:hypothetical protein